MAALNRCHGRYLQQNKEEGVKDLVAKRAGE